MKTLKQIAFAAAVLAAPFMAQASMTSMDDSALSSVTGQAGISIAGDFGGSVGNVAYKDDGQSLNLTTITFTGFSIADSNPLKVDVISIGGVQKLEISLPTMTGTVEVGSINLGGTYTAAVAGPTPTPGSFAGGTNLGGLAISDINMAGTKVRVWGH